MNLTSFFRRINHTPKPTLEQPLWIIINEGIYWASPTEELQEILDFLHDEDLIESRTSPILLWDKIYKIVREDELSGLADILQLPSIAENWRPNLVSRGSLTDEDFRIKIANWTNTATTNSEQLRMSGPLLWLGNTAHLVPESIHQLMIRLNDLEHATDKLMAWGMCRRMALDAGATLDNYLRTTIVLVPDQMRLGVKTTESSGYMIEPTFDDAPEGWLSQYDQRATFSNHIDVSTPDGDLVRVILTEPVKQVLHVLKRSFPTRKVQGPAASSFLLDPLSVLPKGSEQIISSDSIEDEWKDAGILFHEMEGRAIVQNEKIQHFELTLCPMSTNLQSSRFLLDRLQLSELIRSALNSIFHKNGILKYNNLNVIANESTKESINAWEIILQNWILQDQLRIEVRETEEIKPEIFAPSNQWIPESVAVNIDEEMDIIEQEEEKDSRRRIGLRSVEPEENDEDQSHSDIHWSVPLSLRPSIKLRDYQIFGVQWLLKHYPVDNLPSTGVILADDMGLGKTLQILILLASLKEKDPNLLPTLVCAPVSLLENWEKEVANFFEKESFKVLRLHGHDLKYREISTEHIDPMLFSNGITRCLRPGWRDGFDIILTSYDVIREYETSIAYQKWSCVILDEAQKIKNPSAMVTRAARAIPARFRIACTGTPVENSLKDLWSLFHFIKPGHLGPLSDFTESYRRPIEAKTLEQTAKVEELRQLVMPLILRRTKADVAKDLPKKWDMSKENPLIHQLPLSLAQIDICERITGTYRARIENTPKGKGTAALFKALCEMRMACALSVQKSGSLSQVPPPEDMPKASWLLMAISDIANRKEKVLIFTEYKDVQYQIKSWILKKFGIHAMVLNGTSPTSGADSRQACIQRFSQQSGFSVLILGTKAIGFGVNIQAANHVIHYTRSWNPALEDQATDRAYRIGQTREVFVYTPTVTHPQGKWETFEQKLHSLLERKRLLAQDILNGSGDEIEELEMLL